MELTFDEDQVDASKKKFGVSSSRFNGAKDCLTLFLKASNSPVADSKKTLDSLKHESFDLKEIVLIDKFKNIVYDKIGTEWYLILHDDEQLDEQLLEAVPVLLNEDRINVFSFYKKNHLGEYSICPRLFRKNIKISPLHLFPENEREPITNVLNGFVVEHD